MNKSNLVLFLATALLAFGVFNEQSFAEERAYIPVGSAKTKKTILAFPAILVKGANAGEVSPHAKALF
jgi:hypothetical protein